MVSAFHGKCLFSGTGFLWFNVFNVAIKFSCRSVSLSSFLPFFLSFSFLLSSLSFSHLSFLSAFFPSLIASFIFFRFQTALTITVFWILGLQAYITILCDFYRFIFCPRVHETNHQPLDLNLEPWTYPYLLVPFGRLKWIWQLPCSLFSCYVTSIAYLILFLLLLEHLWSTQFSLVIVILRFF